jgi:hypothetical protein
MNLVVASLRMPRLYIADQEKIRIVSTPTGTGSNDPLVFEDTIPKPFEDDGSSGYLLSQFVLPENQKKETVIDVCSHMPSQTCESAK